MDEERMIEYTILFKENTDMYEQYSGEFIATNKWETDDIFKQYKEQIEQYFSKEWVNYDGDWIEEDVEVFYSNI